MTRHDDNNNTHAHRTLGTRGAPPPAKAARRRAHDNTKTNCATDDGCNTTTARQYLLHTMLTNTMMMHNTYHARPYNDDEQH